MQSSVNRIKAQVSSQLLTFSTAIRNAKPSLASKSTRRFSSESVARVSYFFRSSNDKRSWFCCVLGLKPVRAFLFHQLAKAGQNEFAVLFTLLIREGAERIEKYSGCLFIGLCGCGKCGLKFCFCHAPGKPTGSGFCAFLPFPEHPPATLRPSEAAEKNYDVAF
jgi:hypothetical protein